jgi:DMSO/TMAO reductase YedYZ heme-binding membrane subunit
MAPSLLASDFVILGAFTALFGLAVLCLVTTQLRLTRQRHQLARRQVVLVAAILELAECGVVGEETAAILREEWAAC